MSDLDKISRQIIRGKRMEDAVGRFDWRDFERIVGDIFRENGFRVTNNFRFKTSRRWEVDLIASRGDKIFCVDCKRWSEGREKRWSVAKAARDQSRRTRALGKFMESNVMARSMMGISGGEFVPIVATLHEENVLREGGAFVVPVSKLNTFIVECDSII